MLAIAQNTRIWPALALICNERVPAPNGGYVRASAMDSSHTK